MGSSILWRNLSDPFTSDRFCDSPGLLNVIVHRPGWVRSVLKCEWSGAAHLLSRLADQMGESLYRRGSRRFYALLVSTHAADFATFDRSDLKPARTSSENSC